MVPRAPSVPEATAEDVADDATDVGRSPATDEVALLDDRYRLIRLIARGGMSVVHLAEHVQIQRQVALKVLRPPAAIRERFDFADAFRKEARTLASFQHPHVVVLHDFGSLAPGVFFLAMEYVDGPTVRELLDHGPLDPAHAVRLMLQTGLALRYTHQRGVVHRDVKPSNLIVSRDDDGEEVVKVIDFGIAGGDLIAGADIVIGSPDCMAPEQVTSEPISAATDVYGLGCVLFRCVTGRYPFVGGSVEDRMVAHVASPVPSLASAAPDLAQDEVLEAIVRRCLQKKPENRYRDMDALLDDLAAYLDLPDTAWRSGTYVSPRALREAANAVPEVTLAGSRPRTPEPLEEEDEEIAPVSAPSRAPLWAGAAIVLALSAGAAWWAFRDDAPEDPATTALPVVPAVDTPQEGDVKADDDPEAAAPPEAAPTAKPAPAPKAEPKPPPKPKPVRTRPTRSRPAPAETPPPEPKSPPPEGYKSMPEF